MLVQNAPTECSELVCVSRSKARPDMAACPDNISISDIHGPWVEPNWESGLIARCREAWNKPLRTLSKEELATFLRQRYAKFQI